MYAHVICSRCIQPGTIGCTKELSAIASQVDVHMSSLQCTELLRAFVVRRAGKSACSSL